MDDMETFWEKLNNQLIENAAQLDPSFKEKVKADRKELEEHDKRLEAERVARAQREEPKTEWHNLWDKMKTPKS